MDAQFISEALNGKRKGKSYAIDCPVMEHRSAKVILTDGDDGRILVFCQAGCEFRSIVTSLKSQGLWPEATEEQKAHFREEMQKKERENAKTWILVFESNKAIATKADWMKYWKLKRKFKL